MQNRNPPTERDERNGIKASVTSAGPANARTHAATRRVGGHRVNHAQARCPNALTALRVTDGYLPP
jgi:hypothetical protein